MINGQQAAYEREMMPLQEVLAHMHHAGIELDRPFLEGARGELGPRLHDIREAWRWLVGVPITCRDQIAQRLFVDWRWWPESAVLKRNDKLPMTSEALADVAEHPDTTDDGRRAVELYKVYSDASKLEGTYIHPLLEISAEYADKRIRCEFRDMADTGRLRASRPNLQNIPKPSDHLPNIRQAFIALPGWVFLCADYATLEMRILAEMSGEPSMVEAFRANADLHQATADATGLNRHAAKTLNYSLIYGTTKYGLSRRMGISKDDAQAMIDSYFRGYKQVKAWLDQRAVEARATGGVRTITRRFRSLPEIYSPERWQRERAARQAGNTPIQGTAADIVNLASIRLYQRFKQRGWTKGWSSSHAELSLQVHDELLCHVRDDVADIAAQDMTEIMEGVFPHFKVPLKIDLHRGRTWFEAKGG